MIKGFPARTILCLQLLTVATVASASEHRVYVDADTDPATGCTVNTVSDGAFTGVDQRVTTTVDDMSRMVTRIVREDCEFDGGTQFINPIDVETLVGAPPNTLPWPVGVATDGASGIESYFPAPSGSFLIVAASSQAGTGPEDFARVDQLLTAPTLIEIPTLSAWSLLFLALMLAGAAVLVLRRHPSLFICFLALGLLGLTSDLITPDGTLGDWFGINESATDGNTDGSPNGELIRFFAVLQGSTVFVRFDLEPPPTMLVADPPTS